MSRLQTPNERALQLTGRDYISYSAISTYQQCPLKYRFRYVDRLPEEFVSANLVFGSAIHAAAELHFNELMIGGPPPDVDELLVAYNESWDLQADKDIRYRQGQDRSHHEGLAKRLLTAFQESDLSQPAGTILGVEEELRGQVIQGCPDLLARIDLVVETDDAVVVTDLKTSRSRWSSTQAEQASDQLMLYGELAGELACEKPVLLQFAVITKTKVPSVEIHPVSASTDRVAWTKLSVQYVWQAIDAEHFYPSPSAMNCGGCPYRQSCRKWRA
ncbi:MAG: PD-(D/E)XK nuclease family protein [Pirellulales bacterium]